MTVYQKDYQRSYRYLMLIVAVALLGWVIPYGIANYKLDRCSEDLQIRLDAIKAKIDSAKSAIDQK